MKSLGRTQGYGLKTHTPQIPASVVLHIVEFFIGQWQRGCAYARVVAVGLHPEGFVNLSAPFCFLTDHDAGLTKEGASRGDGHSAPPGGQTGTDRSPPHALWPYHRCTSMFHHRSPHDGAISYETLVVRSWNLATRRFLRVSPGLLLFVWCRKNNRYVKAIGHLV